MCLYFYDIVLYDNFDIKNYRMLLWLVLLLEIYHVSVDKKT